MWIVMCRYYAIVGEFAGEVLKKHYLVGNLHLGLEDYARFIANKATWHPELEAIARERLRNFGPICSSYG